MGCDIHVFVEARTRGIASGDARLRDVQREVAAGIKDPAELDRLTPWGPWTFVPQIRRENLPGFVASGEPLDYSQWDILLTEGGKPLVPEIVLWDSRSYATFNVLAGVRGELETSPVSNPGVPSDASAEYRREFESWGGDAHSEHWVTVRQFFDWLGTDYTVEEHFLTKGEFRLSAGLLRFMVALRERWGLDGARILFFFDN